MDGFNLSQYCPELFEDETLYSWISRWAYDSPYPSIGGFLKVLLGTRHKQLDSMFPSYVSTLANISSISEEELINQHSVIPYFRSFCGNSLFQAILTDIYAGNTKTVHSKMSITAGRINDTKMLNYCHLCVENDIEKYGIAYWHVQHQLPGVSACVQHGQKLKEINKGRRRAIKPPQETSEDNFKQASSVELKLAKFSYELLFKDISKFDGEKLSSIYRHKLHELGMTSPCLTIHQAEVRKALEDYWMSLPHVDAIDHIFELGGGHTYPSCLFYHAKAHHHPLKHLLMIGMLFESFDELVVFSKNIQPTDLTTEEDLVSLEYEPEKVKIALLELINGNSLRHASSVSGLSVIKVKQIAIVNGIYVNRREQQIFSKDRQVIFKKLSLGYSTEHIAEEMNCSVGSVEQILSQHPELLPQRKKIRFIQRRQFHRAKLISTLKSNNTKTRSALQKKVRASYTWLFKHDNEWLYKNLPKRQKSQYWPKKPKGSDID